MFPKTSLHRCLASGRLQVPHLPTWLPSYLPARFKVSGDYGLFPQNHWITRIHKSHWPYVAVSTPQSPVLLRRWHPVSASCCVRAVFRSSRPNPNWHLSILSWAVGTFVGKLGQGKCTPSASTGYAGNCSQPPAPRAPVRTHAMLSRSLYLRGLLQSDLASISKLPPTLALSCCSCAYDCICAVLCMHPHLPHTSTAFLLL